MSKYNLTKIITGDTVMGLLLHPWVKINMNKLLPGRYDIESIGPHVSIGKYAFWSGLG